MFAPADPIALGKLILDAGKWLADVINSRKNREEQVAAQILKEAGVLVAAIRVLDNSTRKVLAPFLRMEADWTKEQRSKLFDALDDYVREKSIISTIRLSIATLNGYLSNPKALDKSLWESIDSHLYYLLKRATNILDVVEGRNPEMDFFNNYEFLEFWRILKNAKDEDEIAQVAKWTAEALNKFDRRLAAYTEEDFGLIKSAILQKYPYLPDPLWTKSA